MFVRQPQFRNASADVQMFYGNNRTGSSAIQKYSWSKPPGVSHVYIMLIGCGGNGDGTNLSGGSGSVTVWYGAAQNIPDALDVWVANSNGGQTSIFYKSGTIQLLFANGANSTTGGSAMTANAFTASGFFQSVAGANGVGGSVGPSSTTFLSAGGYNSTDDATANYEYSTGPATATRNGYFMLQPIIVGVGGTNTGRGGVGCGGGGSNVSVGGPGMVLIASW
jgi:hypothetical protein